MGPSLKCVRNRSASTAGAGNSREQWQETSLEKAGGDTPLGKALNHWRLLGSHYRVLSK